jgi:hypothetical protein
VEGLTALAKLLGASKTAPGGLGPTMKNTLNRKRLDAILSDDYIETDKIEQLGMDLLPKRDLLRP